jgi:hypothetical protein
MITEWGSQSWLQAAFPGGLTRWKAGPRAELLLGNMVFPLPVPWLPSKMKER